MKKDKPKGMAVPNQHWEKRYDPCVYKDTKTTRGFEFNPMKSTHRITTYNKTNEQDH